jgi:peptidoglycan/xylan/chitin deacetylase (PgdA/CDA1 family)
VKNSKANGPYRPGSGGDQATQDHFILMYHHVGSLEKLGAFTPFVVTPSRFREQLDTIERRGLPITTVRDLVQAEKGDRSEHRIALTFDDCPEHLLAFAVPELERRGWKASFFAVAGKVGGTNDWDKTPGMPRVPLMQWGHLRELAALGHEIGSHGFSHQSLRQCGTAEALLEMAKSKDALEQQLGNPVETLAYPFGDTPDGYPDLCRKTGYRAACSIFSESRSALADRFMIRRILVSERDGERRMRIKLSRPYLHARALLVDRRVLRQNGNLPSVDTLTNV